MSYDFKLIEHLAWQWLVKYSGSKKRKGNINCNRVYISGLGYSFTGLRFSE